MEDIAPGLWKKIKEDFEKSVEEDAELRRLMEELSNTTRPTYRTADRIAARFGELTSQALKNNLFDGVLPDGKMYYNIAERTILPALEQDYNYIIDVIEQVQTAINESVGTQLRAQLPAFNMDRAEGIINRLTSEEHFSDASWILGEPVENFSMSIVDEAVEQNAEFQYSAGRKSYIKRRVEGSCCKWCAGKAGTYEYPDVPKDIYRRHSYCRCTVEYVADDGTVKDVHNGRQGQKTKEQEKKDSLQRTIEEIEKNERQRNSSPTKKEFEAQLNPNEKNSRIFVNAVVDNRKVLAEYSPEEMKTMLERKGFSVLPLSGGSLAGIRFEEGGGFKVNFGGDGIFQYHPEKQSHHGGEYYKIKNGNGGYWFDTKGNLIRKK